jgi:hypothetical protein
MDSGPPGGPSLGGVRDRNLRAGVLGGTWRTRGSVLLVVRMSTILVGDALAVLSLRCPVAG